MKTVCEGRLDGRRRKGRPPISLVTNLTTACRLSLHQIVQKSQDRAGWQQKVRSSIATAHTASGDADRVESFPRIRGISFELGSASARLAPAVVLILCKNRGQTPLETAVRKTMVRGLNIATGSFSLLFCVSILASIGKIGSMHRIYAS
ncbi:hypothetical protein ElyMa_001688200 [Elysia marginata]|uniref:Uncharacterized protein n=1 Tax=Elysia marginata TaxID=1093978 RepID=A0AAV4JRR2_9GAST|nr:hypothetical protein ElyMa_001688200 [Elysia marginata]